MKRTKNLIMLGILVVFVKFFFMRTKSFKMVSHFVYELAIRLKNYAFMLLTKPSMITINK